MKNNLAENIRSFRKSMGFTQEQLAERLGVTLAAVSKWERGNSEPDLSFIMDLAEVFHVSVDVLVGFSMHSTDAEAEAERIEQMVGVEPDERILEEYDTALKKFPNNFRVVFGAARCYAGIGIMYRQEPKIRNGLGLLQRSIDLISQNTFEEIGEADIRNDIAQCYAALKNYNKAIEEYKRNNVSGINNARIGLLYTENVGKPEEGILYTQKAFLGDVTDMITALCGCVSYCYRTAKYDEGMMTALWSIGFLESLKKDPDRHCYLDKIVCLFYMDLAMMQDGKGMTEASEENLLKAAKMAADFDRDPNNTFENMILQDNVEKLNIYDDAGQTAMDGMLNVLEDYGSFVSEGFKKKAERMFKAKGEKK